MKRPLVRLIPLLLLSATAAAADAVSAFFALPRPAGASLDVVLRASGKEPSRGTLDLRREGATAVYRMEMVEGPQKGTAALLDLRADGSADRLYAFKPALGVEAVSWRQLQGRFYDLGVPLSDLVEMVQPERLGAPAGWTATPQGAAVQIQAPPDASGCRDSWEFPSASAPLPSRASLCPDAPWPARQVLFSGEVALGTAKLPAKVEIQEATGRSLSLEIAPSPAPRWQQTGRFERSNLGRP